MVMPCSRSAASPSTRSAKSISSPWVPWRLLSDSSAASWSSKICLDSYNSRPIRVDLPSSTLPQVMKRSSSFCSWLASHARTSSRAAPRLVLPTRRSITRLRHSRESGNPGACGRSKIALLLFLLHACAAGIAVNHPALTLRTPRHEHLGDDVLDRLRLALDRPRQRVATERAEAHLAHHRLLAVQREALVVDHQDHAVAFHRRPLRRIIQRHDLDLLLEDVLPHVELGPVGQREHADALAPALADIVQRPQLGPLALGVPAVVFVAEAEDALLGPALLLVPAGAAERRVEPVFVERLLQPLGLPHVGVQRPVDERIDAAALSLRVLVDHQLDRRVGRD